jgi:superfamily II DNA helicase RecQ
MLLCNDSPGFTATLTVTAGEPSLQRVADASAPCCQVRSDIVANLRLKPDARKWVMSFERHNLHFAVRARQPPRQMAANFDELLSAGRSDFILIGFR